MTQLVPNQPLRTRVPTITVDGNLPIGRHRFQLVVVDNDGNRSAPDEVVVTIVRRGIGPVPDPRDPREPPVRPDSLPPVDPREPLPPIGPRLPLNDPLRPRGLPPEGDEQ